MADRFVIDITTINNEFFSLSTRKDIAHILKIKNTVLIHCLYVKPLNEQYVEFRIPKKNGSYRTITAPTGALKIVQQRLNIVLQNVIQFKACAHGFINHRSVVTNAYNHLKKNLVLNIDLKDFFPSINFGRVYGLFIGYPFNFNKIVASK